MGTSYMVQMDPSPLQREILSRADRNEKLLQEMIERGELQHDNVD